MFMHEAIEKRIAEFLSADDPEFEWTKPAVRAHRFLPLYIGWLAVLGIRPDGSFVRWNHEDDRSGVTPESHADLQRMAICYGARKYPELRALLPERPAAALTCSACGGTGEVGGNPRLVCQCGGTGWIIPGEQPSPSPG
jgi:hypothetical protein